MPVKTSRPSKATKAAKAVETTPRSMRSRGIKRSRVVDDDDEDDDDGDDDSDADPLPETPSGKKPKVAKPALTPAPVSAGAAPAASASKTPSAFDIKEDLMGAKPLDPLVCLNCVPLLAEGAVCQQAPGRACPRCQELKIKCSPVPVALRARVQQFHDHCAQYHGGMTTLRMVVDAMLAEILPEVNAAIKLAKKSSIRVGTSGDVGGDEVFLLREAGDSIRALDASVKEMQRTLDSSLKELQSAVAVHMDELGDRITAAIYHLANEISGARAPVSSRAPVPEVVRHEISRAPGPFLEPSEFTALNYMGVRDPKDRSVVGSDGGESEIPAEGPNAQFAQDA